MVEGILQKSDIVKISILAKLQEFLKHLREFWVP